MRRYAWIAIVALTAIVGAGSYIARAPGPVTQSAPTVSPNSLNSADLVNSPRQWDGETVTFEGEAITQAMYRGDHAWVHINDDAYYLKNVEEGSGLGGYNSGHAVWVPAELARTITYFGDYRHEGDVVRVRGTFNAACGQHGGDMDIHAESLQVVVEGHRFNEPVHPVKTAVAVVLAALAALMWFAQRRARHLDMFGPSK